MKMINEEMRKKKEGLTLREKIEKHLGKVRKRGLVSLIEDAFYEPKIERGCQFYVLKTHLMTHGRSLNIIDEVEERLKEQEAFETAEAARDMTKEEFLATYLDHIEGRINTEEKEAQPDEDGGDLASPKEDGKEEGEGEGAEGEEGEKPEGEVEASPEKPKEDEKQKDESIQEIQPSDYKFEIPDSCFLPILKGTRIEKLEKKYHLGAHPYPTLDGQMLLFQPTKDD